MTDLRKAADMALEALEFSLPAIEDFGSKEQLTDCHRAIMALYKALAQPEQEPVAWITFVESFCGYPKLKASDTQKEGYVPVYTAPPKREWVWLRWGDMPETYAGDKSFLEGARWAEAKLKEKNT